MADTNKEIMSVVVADQNSKLSDFAIGNKQMIFIGDKRTIALDFNGKRSFYNQIEVLTTESERQTIDPISGLFYFVLETAGFWYYGDDWQNVAATTSSTVYIGSLLPEVGEENKLYVDAQKKAISIWNAVTQDYDVVADKKDVISQSEIDMLFA